MGEDSPYLHPLPTFPTQSDTYRCRLEWVFFLVALVLRKKLLGMQLTGGNNCSAPHIVWGVAGRCQCWGWVGTQHIGGTRCSSSLASRSSEKRGTPRCNVAGVSQDALGSTQIQGEPGGSHWPGGRVPYPG